MRVYTEQIGDRRAERSVPHAEAHLGNDGGIA